MKYSRIKKARIHTLPWLFFGVLFAAYYQKNPLYTKNQNTKFLHGAGDAGFGFLEHDWMAGTLDPLPLFSAIITTLYNFNVIEVTYFFFAALLFIYFYSLSTTAETLFSGLKKTGPMLLYLGLFFFFHRANPAGLADQYLLGSYFQPCVFGVFLLLSIERFLNNHTRTASTLLALSAAFHPAYLPTALIVQVNYTFMLLFREKQGLQKAIPPLLLFTVFSAPLVIRHLVLFAPTTAALNAKAMDILANQRIPHHTDIRLWLEPESFLQMGIVLVSMLLVRKSRLFPIMLSLYLVIVFSGLYLYFYPNPLLSFSTPWRSSAFLVPLSITILAGWAGQMSVPLFDRYKTMLPAVSVFTGMAIIILTVLQVNKQMNAFERYRNGEEMGVINYASQNASPEDLYVIPPQNSAFDKFRLETGIPVLINNKTHPYKDIEVIEWNARSRKAQAFYAAHSPREKKLALSHLVGEYRVTHCIVSTNMQSIAGLPGEAVYVDEHYTVLKLHRPIPNHSGLQGTSKNVLLAQIAALSRQVGTLRF